jgi:hypothetical protein
VRLPGDTLGGDPVTWQSREDSWTSFWKTRGKEPLHRPGKATVNGENIIVYTFSLAERCVEAFWVDLVVQNPFNTEVNLSDLTVIVTGLPTGSKWTSDLVDVEILDEIILDPKEIRTVNMSASLTMKHGLTRSKIPMSILARQPMTLQISHVSYVFLSLLPAKEPLVSRGRRLQDTPHQRQNKVYSPDIARQSRGRRSHSAPVSPVLR